MLQKVWEKTSVNNHQNHAGSFSSIFYLEDVSVNYGGIWALKSLQLSIEKGEVVFITGASGAGKTTLLKILTGELTPDSGRVRLPYDRQNRNGLFTAPVFQDLRLTVKSSCEENLWMAYDPAIYSSKAEFNHDMLELCRILDIEERLHLKIAQANGGLKQKVAIIRALLAKPDVFIADEPTSSLDFENAKKLFEILNLYNTKKGMTVVWASHNSELVKRFTGRIIHLNGGKLVYSGHACFI